MLKLECKVNLFFKGAIKIIIRNKMDVRSKFIKLKLGEDTFRFMRLCFAFILFCYYALTSTKHEFFDPCQKCDKALLAFNKGKQAYRTAL